MAGPAREELRGGAADPGAATSEADEGKPGRAVPVADGVAPGLAGLRAGGGGPVWPESGAGDGGPGRTTPPAGGVEPVRQVERVGDGGPGCAGSGAEVAGPIRDRALAGIAAPRLTMSGAGSEDTLPSLTGHKRCLRGRARAAQRARESHTKASVRGPIDADVMAT